MKILKGLNSNTFNYLEEHKDQLNIGKNTKIDEVHTIDATKPIKTQTFFSDCVRLNAPCFMD